MGKILTLLLMRYWNFLTRLLSPIGYEPAVVMNCYYAKFKDPSGIPYLLISEMCVLNQSYTRYRFKKKRYIQRVKVLYMVEGQEYPVNIFHFPLLCSMMFVNTEGPLISAMNSVLRLDKFKELKIDEESIAYRRGVSLSSSKR